MKTLPGGTLLVLLVILAVSGTAKTITSSKPAFLEKVVATGSRWMK